jgi:hypothetical protein
MMPLALLAQVNAFDGESRATVVGMVQHVGATLASGAIARSGGEDEESEVIGAPVPELEDPELEPQDEPLVLPDLNLTDLAEYSNQGVTFTAPADWIVDTNTNDGVPFEITIPGTDLQATMELDANLDFPSWLGLALFRTQGEILVENLGVGANLDEAATLYTTQNLPVAKMAFSGIRDDIYEAGALYVGAPNETAYLVIIVGTEEEVSYAMPGIDLIVESLTFEENDVTVTLAEDGPLVYSDEDETMEVTVPAGWYVMGTGDTQFPIIIGEPEVLYVVAAGTENVFGDEFDPAILEEFIPEDGELDAEMEQALFETVLEMVDNSGTPINLDEELSALTARQGAITVRLVGEANLGNEFSLPVALYVDLRPTDVGVMGVFGELETALELEDELTRIMESITGL